MAWGTLITKIEMVNCSVKWRVLVSIHLAVFQFILMPEARDNNYCYGLCTDETSLKSRYGWQLTVYNSYNNKINFRICTSNLWALEEVCLAIFATSALLYLSQFNLFLDFLHFNQSNVIYNWTSQKMSKYYFTTKMWEPYSFLNKRLQL